MCLNIHLIRPLFKEDPVGLEKQPIEVQDVRKITGHLRGVVYGVSRISKGEPIDHNM